jgi:cysteinyl-tRNA synthetase
MHNGMLNINNEKMSKSAGNFILGKDIVATYGGQVVRWVMNATHYRAPINFSDEIFDAAISELNKIYTSLKQASLKLDLSDSFDETFIDENYKEKYLEQLSDDLNVSGAMTILYDVVKELNQTIRTREVNLERLNVLFNTLNYMLDLIGMNKYDRKLTDLEKSLYNDWVVAKNEKDFAKADEIRKQLIEKGIL